MTTTTTQTTKCIAWRLSAPSTSGGKVYTIAVIGEWLITGWGRRTTAGTLGIGSQTKIERFYSNDSALVAALDRTRAKEDHDYNMDVHPRAMELVLPADGEPTTGMAQQVLRNGRTV
jgi:predicted DNA-binding WGR domain protein